MTEINLQDIKVKAEATDHDAGRVHRVAIYSPDGTRQRWIEQQLSDDDYAWVCEQIEEAEAKANAVSYYDHVVSLGGTR